MTEKLKIACWGPQVWARLASSAIVLSGSVGIMYSQMGAASDASKSEAESKSDDKHELERLHGIISFSWACLAASVLQIFLGSLMLFGTVKKDAISLASYLAVCPFVYGPITVIFFIHLVKHGLTALEITSGFFNLGLQASSIYIVYKNMITANVKQSHLSKK